MASKNRINPASRNKAIILIIVTGITLSLHYGALGDSLLVGDLFRRLCYIPILLGAFWFGSTGGVIVASIISLSLIPRIGGLSHHHGDLGGEIVEIVFYFMLGVVFGILADQERRSDKARRESEKKLAKAEHFSSLGEMASHLAHEIKNPLGSIKGAAEIIMPEINPDSPRREFADILIKEVDRLNRFVEDFLRYAKPVGITKRPTSLDDLLSGTMSKIDAAFPNAAISKRIAGEKGLSVPADGGKMEQVLLNLALNSVKAMPNGGELVFEASRIGNDIAISVTDTGKGIAPDDMKKIFNPFFTTDPRGTGLGLAISERIVREHGGSIEVESVPGTRTKFTITLPAGV